MSFLRTQEPITTDASCFEKAVDHFAEMTTAAAYGSRIGARTGQRKGAAGGSLVRDDPD
jgi:hypothetical protein